MAIPELTKESIVQALKFIDENGIKKRQNAKKYALVVGNKKYPPKYVIAVARHLQDDVEINTEDYNAVEAVNYFKARDYTIKEIGDAEMEPFAQEDNLKENVKQLLTHNYNIILHGAPGTGKTYLAKDVAIDLIFDNDNDRVLFRKKEEDLKSESEKTKYKELKDQFNKHYCFVQFHQSYDYTDFVEGLRPQNGTDGKIGFAPKDGVFKEFCINALKNLVDSRKTQKDIGKENFWQDKCIEYIGDCIDAESKFTNKRKNEFYVTSLEADDITIVIPNNPIKKELNLNLADLVTVLKEKGRPKMVMDVNVALNRKSSTKRQEDSYLFILAQNIYDVAKSQKKEDDVAKVEKEDFIFVIDEINRGEMSKIFGELFFSIDPGYRGIEGKIRTQYANLQKGPNKFDEFLCENDKYGHFFVPENVYIIGTMNDIDRSVESMDFAMRRRFAFKEIPAEQSKTMLDKPDSWKNGNGEKIDVSSCLEDIKKRMDNLNKAILNKEFNLGQAYQIGGAYFLKFANYCKTDDNKKAVENQDEAYKSLWTNHLECVIREYLRGMDNVEGKDGKLEKLKDAYDFKVIYKDDGTIDTNAKNGKPSAEAKGDHVDGKDKQTEETDA